jgi:hypothetical protein
MVDAGNIPVIPAPHFMRDKFQQESISMPDIDSR